jgi:DNA polymerase-3 subunit delta
MLPPKAIEHRAILLTGSEELLRRRALAQLLDVTGAKESHEAQSYDAGESAFAEWMSSASTAPFISERRVVIVRNVQRAGPEDSVAKELKTLPETGLLIFVAEEEAGDSEKQRKMESARRAWETAVSKGAGMVVNFEKESEDIRKWVREEATTLGKEVTPKAMATLIEMTGGSLSSALEELGKAAVYVGEQKQIGEADVRAVAVASREWKVYNMVDAALTGNVGAALAQLRILVDSPLKLEEAAFARIFPTVSRQLKLIWQARILIEAGLTSVPTSPREGEVGESANRVRGARPETQDLLSQFPEKPNLAKEKDWTRDKAMRAGRKIGFTQLRECFQALADADASMKGLRPSFSTYEVLEQMVMRMAASVKSPA